MYSKDIQFLGHRGVCLTPVGYFVRHVFPLTYDFKKTEVYVLTRVACMVIYDHTHIRIVGIHMYGCELCDEGQLSCECFFGTQIPFPVGVATRHEEG